MTDNSLILEKVFARRPRNPSTKLSLRENSKAGIINLVNGKTILAIFFIDEFESKKELKRLLNIVKFNYGDGGGCIIDHSTTEVFTYCPRCGTRLR